jgi:hypothetical protein
MSKKVKANKGHYFELMDRCYVQTTSIELFIKSNPHIQANKRRRKQIEQAQSLIMDVYQWAGRMDYEEAQKK